MELTNFQFPDFPFPIENNWLEKHLELRSTKHRWLSDFPLFIENHWLESHLHHHPWRSDVPFSIEYRWLERHLTTVVLSFSQLGTCLDVSIIFLQNVYRIFG